MAWLTNWNYRKQVTIDETKVDADLTDFSVLVKLTSANFNFSHALSTGYDIRFTSSDGTTLLKYERERHDATNQVAEYWVKIPSVSGSANTVFYIYYGNSGASDGADPTNVWDANFKGVWHLKEDPSGTAPQIKDSTVNGNNGTSEGTMTSADVVDGKIGKAIDFDGTNDAIKVGTATIIGSAANSTVEAWAKFDTLGTDAHIYSENDSGGISFGLRKNSTNVSQFGLIRSGSWYWATSVATLSAATWYYLAGSLSSTGGMVNYINGAQDGSNTNTLPCSYTIVNDWIARIGQGYYLDGIIDELRISNVARSAAWIKASYNSGNDTLVSWGSEETAYIPRHSGTVGVLIF